MSSLQADDRRVARTASRRELATLADAHPAFYRPHVLTAGLLWLRWGSLSASAWTTLICFAERSGLTVSSSRSAAQCPSGSRRPKPVFGPSRCPRRSGRSRSAFRLPRRAVFRPRVPRTEGSTAEALEPPARLEQGPGLGQASTEARSMASCSMSCATRPLRLRSLRGHIPSRSVTTRAVLDHGDDGPLLGLVPALGRGDRGGSGRGASRVARGTDAGRGRDDATSPQVKRVRAPDFRAGGAGSIPVTRSVSSDPCAVNEPRASSRAFPTWAFRQIGAGVPLVSSKGGCSSALRGTYDSVPCATTTYW